MTNMAIGNLNELESSLSEANVSSIPPAANEPPPAPRPLRDCVAEAMEYYFAQLDGQPATGVYQMVLAEIEAPLLEAVMRYTRDNQTKASEMLGLNRGTLRKKLKQYNML